MRPSSSDSCRGTPASLKTIPWLSSPDETLPMRRPPASSIPLEGRRRKSRVDESCLAKTGPNQNHASYGGTIPPSFAHKSLPRRSISLHHPVNQFFQRLPRLHRKRDRLKNTCHSIGWDQRKQRSPRARQQCTVATSGGSQGQRETSRLCMLDRHGSRWHNVRAV